MVVHILVEVVVRVVIGLARDCLYPQVLPTLLLLVAVVRAHPDRLVGSREQVDQTLYLAL